MSLTFGATASLRYGAHASAKLGGSTWLIIARRDAVDAVGTGYFLSTLDSGAVARSLFGVVANKLRAHNGAASSDTATMDWTSTDGWVCLAVTKVAGSTNPRFHKYVYSTGVATHESGGVAIVDAATPAGAGGMVAIASNVVGTTIHPVTVDTVAMFDRALSDAECESAAQSLANIMGLGPTWGLWTLDSASLTGATEHFIGSAFVSGTATSLASTDPPLSYGHQIPAQTKAPNPITLAAVWDPVRARVVLTAAAIPSGATTASIVRYDTAVLTNGAAVRGGTLGGTDPGTGFALSDYEHTPGALNTYVLTVPGFGTATATVTPTPSTVWLKSIARPFLNRAVTVVGFSDVVLPARGGVLDVIGRREPVAITEVRGSRQYALTLRAADRAEADALELMLSFGDVLYVQPPSTSCPIPRAMYAYVGDVSFQRAGRSDGAVRYVTLPLTEVAAPDPTIVGYTITWAGVKSTWATWAAVKAAVPTWLALQEYVAAPADEIVG